MELPVITSRSIDILAERRSLRGPLLSARLAGSRVFRILKYLDPVPGGGACA